jgi:hypothetical protein
MAPAEKGRKAFFGFPHLISAGLSFSYASGWLSRSMLMDTLRRNKKEKEKEKEEEKQR